MGPSEIPDRVVRVRRRREARRTWRREEVQALGPAPKLASTLLRESWMTSRRDSLRAAAAASALSALRGAGAPSGPPPAAQGPAEVVGVLIETAPGAEPRVAARLLGLPWVALQGGDGDRRIAAVLEAPGGASLEELAARLLGPGREILAVLPTFVACRADP